MSKVSLTSVVPLTRKVRPHVDEIADWQTSQTAKLLWDRVHDLESRLQAQEATAKLLVDGHNTHDDLIDQVTKQAESATADAAALPSASAGGVDALTVASMVADASPFAAGPTAATFAPLGTVQIMNSPDVSTWAVTSSLDSITFSGGEIRVSHTKLGQWPPVVIAPDGTAQEATIWVFFNIHAQWYATGSERLRPSQSAKGLSRPSQIGPGWLYDPNRWGPMANYVPTVGEQVGFMIVAGSTRSDNRTKVQERSNVLLLAFPADG